MNAVFVGNNKVINWAKSVEVLLRLVYNIFKRVQGEYIMIKDLKGRIFGRLEVIEFDREKTKRKAYWKCKCICGNITSTRGDRLQSNRVKSCGCYKSEIDAIKVQKNHKHKMSGTPIYTRWVGIKERCYNKNSNCYYRYGGRGITICNEWKNDFMNFYNWCINNGYKKNLSIDRIDNSKGYSPENCRFATNKMQCNNRRTNIILEYNNKKFTIKELSELSGLSIKTLHNRHAIGNKLPEIIRPFNTKRSNFKDYTEVNYLISKGK